MPTFVWIIIALTAADLVLLTLVLPRMTAGAADALASAFPPGEPAPDTVWRSRQSISVDLVNFGFCVSLGADERMLHIRPNRLGRLLKLRDASVPWEAITRPERVSLLGRNARAGRLALRLPRWVLDIARPEPDA